MKRLIFVKKYDINVVERMTRFCTCVSQVLTTMVDAFAALAL